MKYQSKVISNHFFRNYIDKCANLLNVKERKVEFQKILSSKYIKVEDLGVSQKGHSKFIVCIKDTFEERKFPTNTVYSMEYAEGIFFES